MVNRVLGSKNIERDITALEVLLSGSLSASVNNIIQPVFNTRDEGAVGDDVADDTTALQATFTAAAGGTQPTVYIYGISIYNSAIALSLADGMKITAGGAAGGIHFTGTEEGFRMTSAMRVLLDEVSTYG